MSRSLGSVGVVLAWLAAVVAATLVGVLAVGAIGSGILPEGQEPLSQAEVSRRLAGPPPTGLPTTTPTETPTRPTDSPTSDPGTTPPDETRALHSSGGIIYVRCNQAAENGVELVSVAPDQGYHFDQQEPEDGGLRVRFESDDSRIEVQIVCVDDQPRIVSDADDDDNSGPGGDDD